MNKDNIELYGIVITIVIGLVGVVISVQKRRFLLAFLIVIGSLIITFILSAIIKPDNEVKSNQNSNDNGIPSSSDTSVKPLETAIKSIECTKGDCVNGYGKLVYPNGDYYEGFFKNGLKHGKGKIDYSKTRTIYFTEFREDKPIGWGCILNYEGDTLNQGFFDENLTLQ